MKLSSILIVDDSEDDRYLLKRFIKKSGLADTVIEACDGGEALEILSTARITPELIFLDINMPRVGGFEFLEQYQEVREENSSLVVVMVSSSDLDDDKKRANQYSFVKGFVVKMPESSESLKLQIESFLSED